MQAMNMGYYFFILKEYVAHRVAGVSSCNFLSLSYEIQQCFSLSIKGMRLMDADIRSPAADKTLYFTNNNFNI